MITSSNFFNKNLFAEDDEPARSNLEMGPWVQNRPPARHSTLDPNRSISNLYPKPSYPIYTTIRNSKELHSSKMGHPFQMNNPVEIEFQENDNKSLEDQTK